MMSFDWTSMLIGFLAGTVAGAAGTYFGNKYTDRRREQEAGKRDRRRFLEVKRQMPQLFDEMKADFAAHGRDCTREFFVLSNERVGIGRSNKLRFTYYEDQHENLRGKLDILEGIGYISNVSETNTPIYRMTNGFVDFLLKYG
jgi:hypothetical protein